MRHRTVSTAGLLISAAITLFLFVALPAYAQESGEAYTATAIASEGTTGQISGRIVARIGTYTTPDEKKSLKDAFKKSPASGLAFLSTMSKGYINIEGQPGRKVHAIFTRDRQDGREIIFVGEHVASTLEKSRGIKAEDHPLAVMHLRFSSDGAPTSGEIFPAVKVAVTEDGFLDLQTDNSNRVILINIARQ